MDSDFRSRKIRILDDEPAVSKVLDLLLAAKGWKEGGMTSESQAVSIPRREQLDSVLLDLRCMRRETAEAAGNIGQIRLGLVGRVLVVAAEVADEETAELIERYIFSSLPRETFLQGVKGKLHFR